MFHRRKKVTGAGLLTLALLASPLLALPAQAIPSVSGTVVDDDGDPVEGIQVTAYLKTGSGSYALQDTSYSNASGAFTFATLGDGDYRFKFEDVEPEVGPDYVTEIYDDVHGDVVTAPGAADVELSGPFVFPENIVMDVLASIGGQVTFPGPVPKPGDAHVQLLSQPGGELVDEIVTLEYVEGQANYEFAGLEPGDYSVEVANLEDEKAVSIPASSGTIEVDYNFADNGIDIDLVEGATLLTTLLDGDDTPLEGCLIEVYSLGGGTMVTRSTTTNGSGAGVVSGITGGTMRAIRATCDDETRYLGTVDGGPPFVMSQTQPSSGELSFVNGDEAGLGTIYFRGSTDVVVDGPDSAIYGQASDFDVFVASSGEGELVGLTADESPDIDAQTSLGEGGGTIVLDGPPWPGVGTYNLRFSYEGPSLASGLTERNFAVTKAKPTVKKKKLIKTTTKKKGKTRVTVVTQFEGETPTGKVRQYLIRKGFKNKKSSKVTLVNGVAMFRTPKLAKGKWLAKIKYFGDGNHKKGQTTFTIKVKK